MVKGQQQDMRFVTEPDQVQAQQPFVRKIKRGCGLPVSRLLESDRLFRFGQITEVKKLQWIVDQMASDFAFLPNLGKEEA